MDSEANRLLLRAKLRAPAVPPHYVRRGRLLDLFDGIAGKPLTLVIAPAGAGKTSLLAGWSAEHEAPTTWLSLDETDQDEARFWTGVVAALETFRPGCGARTDAALRQRHTAVHAVQLLLDDLADDDTPHPDASVLVIDDLHCTDATVPASEALALFVRHIPPWLHVVLASRRTPSLPLDRMRARGLVNEIRFAELRFSTDEARELLERLAPALPDHRIDQAAARADGLAAGLQLEALHARSTGTHVDRPNARDETAERLIHDFVIQEALAAEDPELVDVLLDISIVDLVDSSLARALTGRSDADDMLFRAEKRGLFVTVIDTRGWFELHSLARAALVAELERRAPDRLADLHRRAARWFELADEIPHALSHLLLAGDAREALRLLAARHAELYDTGLEPTIARTLDAIPFEVTHSDLDAMLEAARCSLLVNRRAFLEAVEEAAWRAGSEPGLSPLTAARVAMLESQAAAVSGNMDESATLARNALETLGEDWWRDPLGRFAWNMIAREAACDERWDDDAAELREARLLLGRDPERRFSYDGTRALGLALAGRPVDALGAAAGMRARSDVSNMTILRTELGVAEAIAHRELGDRSRSSRELAMLAGAHAETMLFCRILALCEHAESHIDDGNLADATDALAEARDLVETESWGRCGRNWVARSASRLALATGAVSDAHDEALQIADPLWRAVGLARVLIAEGTRTDALEVLASAVPRCPRHELVVGLLRARATDDPEEAARTVSAAVQVATTYGMLQTVASEGVEVVDLVEHVAASAPGPWLDRLRRAPSTVGSEAPGHIDLVDPLTDRELDVLRFLPGRLTMREIADELFVSVNTLKYHLRMIYRKLGVTSRTEAAERARQLGSMPRHSLH